MNLWNYINFLGTFFLNYCWHYSKKLNLYNCVFPMHLQVLELDLWFLTIWKINSKSIKVINIVCNFYFYFPAFNIDVANIYIYIICEWNFFHIEIHSQPSKINIIFGDAFGVLFQVQMIIFCTIVFEKLTRGRLKVLMRKSRSSIWFEMLKEGWKFWKLYFLILQVKKKVTSTWSKILACTSIVSFLLSILNFCSSKLFKTKKLN